MNEEGIKVSARPLLVLAGLLHFILKLYEGPTASTPFVS